MGKVTCPFCNSKNTFNISYGYLKEKKIKKNYVELDTNINYRNHILSAFKYIESKNKKTTIFRYISNMDVNDNNIKEIVSLGRKRWKIYII